MREIHPSTPLDGRTLKGAPPAPAASHTNAGVHSRTATDAQAVNDQAGIPMRPAQMYSGTRVPE